MALLITPYAPQIPQVQFPRWSAISKPSILETLFLKPTKYPTISSVSNPASSTLRYAPPPYFGCRTTSSSSAEYNISSPAKVFIKGLPLSSSEGRLVKAFSEFGEVTQGDNIFAGMLYGQVKLLMDKESGQFLGFAYIWFAQEESAQLAVKEMNGKFFDGRFVYVTIAKPGSSKNWRKTAPYRF